MRVPKLILVFFRTKWPFLKPFLIGKSFRLAWDLQNYPIQQNFPRWPLANPFYKILPKMNNQYIHENCIDSSLEQVM